MNGREVFRFATTVMPRAAESVVRKAGWHLDDLKLIIPHQANTRIIESAVKRLSLPPERFFINLERYGNTSSASIPIALCEAIGEGRISSGDKLALVGFGAGLTWAAVAIEWGVPLPARPQPWYRRVFAHVFFFLAGLRSTARRSARRLYYVVAGPMGRPGLSGRVRKAIDRLQAWLRR